MYVRICNDVNYCDVCLFVIVTLPPWERYLNWVPDPAPPPFSESPSGQLNKEISLTDSKREARIAGGSRPGIVYPLPRAARPDTRLEVDAAPPEAAALSRAERPPTVLDIPETGRLEDTRCPESWIALAQAPHMQMAQKPLVWGLPAEEALTTPQPLV